MSDSVPQPDQQESVTIDVSADGEARQQEPQVSSRFVSRVNRYKENLLDRPIRYDVISIVFTVLIFVGGIMGYLKGSTLSLVSGVIFTVLLAFGTYLEGARKNPYPLIVTLFALGALMVYRYVQSFNFLPAGLIGLLTMIMFARHCYLLYLRNKTTNLEPQAEPRPDDQAAN